MTGPSQPDFMDGFDGPRDGEFSEFHIVLSKESIPDPDAPWAPDIVVFALAFDGYQALGGFDVLAELANATHEAWQTSGELPESLIELRSCLFFEQRRFRHFGEKPDEVTMSYIRALLEPIRTHAGAGNPPFKTPLQERERGSYRQ